MRICKIITTVQAIFPHKGSVMSDTLTYISTSFPTSDCFSELTVTLDVEYINGQFITCLVHWLDCVDNSIFAHLLCLYIAHDHSNNLQ